MKAANKCYEPSTVTEQFSSHFTMNKAFESFSRYFVSRYKQKPAKTIVVLTFSDQNFQKLAEIKKLQQGAAKNS
jgi:uncharacterized glyoxalase superfamily metalloenzyme YdcJ